MFALRPVELLKIDSNKDVSCEYCELLITYILKDICEGLLLRI